MDYAFMRFPDFKLRAVTLSYDDGMVYDIKLVGILNEYGLKCTFNLNSGLFSPDGKGERRRLTAEEAIKLYKNSGHEIAVHGLKHLNLKYYPTETAVFDIIEDRKNLESLFGGIIKGMAYAYGTYNDETVRAVKSCGINYARTTVSTEKFDIPEDWLKMPATCHHQSARLSELTEKFLEEEKGKNFIKPRLFYLWGHSYEFHDNDNWDVIENFAKKTSSYGNIWFATNKEVYDYVRAFNSLCFSAQSDVVYNPTCIDVCLNVYGKEFLVPGGKSISIK